jgi:NAD(P)H-dependent flavin oxidoreductase YrpB (nitropropane dioxygenase family)
VRQLWDGKGSAEIETMTAATMSTYAGLCGWSLARAHARTGDRRAIASYLGHGDKFDHAIAEFSEAYADQNEADYQVVIDAERAGTLKVESGV